MESISGPAPINPVNGEPSFFSENWPHFIVKFTVISTLVPCILSSVKLKPTIVIKLFCDHPILTWQHVNDIPSRPLTHITKGPQNAVTSKFAKSIEADMDFHHCLSPYCFDNQVVTSCMGLLIKGPWFIFANTEIGGCASFALLNKGIEIWCACTSSNVTRFFERCCLSPKAL